MHRRTLITILILALLLSLAANVYLAWRLHVTRDRLDRSAWEAFAGALQGLDAIDEDLNRILESERAGEEDLRLVRRRAVAFAEGLERVMRLARQRGLDPDIAVDPVVTTIIRAPERLETTLSANGRPVGGRPGVYVIEGLAWSDFVDVRTMVRRLRDTGRRILAEAGPDQARDFLRRGVWARAIEEMAAGVW